MTLLEVIAILAVRQP